MVQAACKLWRESIVDIIIAISDFFNNYEKKRQVQYCEERCVLKRVINETLSECLPLMMIIVKVRPNSL